ncbi:MAG: type II toxin-antitoxin system PemK/MazF family toxin [Thauera sp.]|jgi:mRNA interferase MazF|nr:type II toxin-antitoxin system PemK/MazF family toxin [Thauera sp.]
MRGSLVTIATQGDFGKPRPALVIQSDLFDGHPSVTVLPITSALVEAPLLRITLRPDEANGLEKPSQVMIDKTITVRRDKLGPVFGRVDLDVMLAVDRSLAVFLGIAR